VFLTHILSGLLNSDKFLQERDWSVSLIEEEYIISLNMEEGSYI